MKRAFKVLLLLSLGLALLALIGGLATWQQLAVTPGMTVSINGEHLDLEGLGDSFGLLSGLGALIGVFVAGLVLCLIVPLVLLLSLGLPILLLCLMLGGMLLGVFSLGALLFSPLILLVLLLWLVFRPKSKPSPKANIAA